MNEDDEFLDLKFHLNHFKRIFLKNYQFLIDKIRSKMKVNKKKNKK